MQLLIVGDRKKHIYVPCGFQLVDVDSILRFDLFTWQSHNLCHYNLVQGEVVVLNVEKDRFDKVDDEKLICDENGSFVTPLTKAGFHMIAVKKQRANQSQNIAFLDEDTTWIYLNGKLERKK